MLKSKENNKIPDSHENMKINDNSSICNKSPAKSQISQMDFYQIIKRNNKLDFDCHSEERIDNINIQEVLDGSDSYKWYLENASCAKDIVTEEIILYSDRDNSNKTLNEVTKKKINNIIHPPISNVDLLSDSISSNKRKEYKEDENVKRNENLSSINQENQNLFLNKDLNNTYQTILNININNDKSNNNVNDNENDKNNDNKNIENNSIENNNYNDKVLLPNDDNNNNGNTNYNSKNDEENRIISNELNKSKNMIDTLKNDHDNHLKDHPTIEKLKEDYFNEYSHFKKTEEMQNYSEIEKAFMSSLINDLRNENNQLKEKIDSLDGTLSQLKSQVHSSNLENRHIEEELEKLESKNQNLKTLYKKYKEIGFNLHNEIKMLNNEWENIFQSNNQYIMDFKKRYDDKVFLYIYIYII